MQTHTEEITRKGLCLKLCAWDVLVALAALELALILMQPGMKGYALLASQTDKVTRFLVIAALPSILLGVILAYTAKTRGFLYHIAKTTLSMLISYVLFLALKESSQSTLLNEMELICGLTIFAVLNLGSEVTRQARIRARDKGKVLLVGNGQLATRLATLLRDTPRRYELVGTVDVPTSEAEGRSFDPNGILETAKRLKAHKILISLTERRGIFPLQAVLNCKLSGMEVLDAPDMYERITGKLLIENITPSWFIFCHGFKVTQTLRAVKRAIDIVISLFGLLLVAPFAPLVALAIRLDSPGPIFFRQIRVGQGDRLFSLIKFRSMRQNAEKDTGAVWACNNDSRVTRLGRFLRKSRIDEIPQLFNVLVGDMSLVGPRPERPEFVDQLKERIPYYSERHYVKPGVSGWAQVCYPYGASVEDAVEKLRYDMFYIKNLSLMLDIKIIFKTILVMLCCKGGR